MSSKTGWSGRTLSMLCQVYSLSNKWVKKCRELEVSETRRFGSHESKVIQFESMQIFAASICVSSAGHPPITLHSLPAQDVCTSSSLEMISFKCKSTVCQVMALTNASVA